MTKVHSFVLQRHASGDEMRRHVVKVAVAVRNTRWCSDGLEIAAENGEPVSVAFALSGSRPRGDDRRVEIAGITSEDVRELVVAAVEHRFGSIN